MKQILSREMRQILGAFILLLLMVGCNAATSGDSEKVLTIGNSTDMLSFDIHNHGNTVTEAIHANIFEYLVNKSDDELGLPGLALAYSQVDDLTWRFELREDVTWHNGDPFTSEDVKYTLDRVSQDESLIEYSTMNIIAETKLIDDHTIDIITKEPDPAFLNRLSRIGSGILPSKYIAEHGFDHFLENPIGTGPYVFVEWVRDDKLVLEKNENYYGEEPKWDQVVFRSLPEDSTRVSELLTGGVDIITNLAPTDIERVNANDGTHSVDAPSHRVVVLIARLTEGSVTSDSKVRKAIDLAIDNSQIVDGLLDGAGIPTKTLIPGFDPNSEESLYNTFDYNPDEARALLKEAGYDEGEAVVSLNGPIGRFPRDRETVELIGDMLTEVGFKVDIELESFSTYRPKYDNRELGDLALFGYGNSLFDPALPLSRHYTDQSIDRTDYSNPEVDALLDQALTNLDIKERQKQFQHIQQIVAEELPYIHLYNQVSVYGVSDRVTFHPRLDEIFFVDEVQLNDE